MFILYNAQTYKKPKQKTSLADIFRIIKMIKNHLLDEVKVINKATKIAIQIF